jgi:hypothetical protein
MSTTRFHLQGWFQTFTEGVPTIYLSASDEGLITQPTDTPASTAFRPRILNADQFSIKRVAVFWPMGDTTAQIAAFGQLRIDNYDGAFNFLTRADMRDANVVFKLPRANMLAAPNTVATAPIIATAVLEDAQSDDDNVITVTFKDTLARLDRQLLVQYNPPYADASCANRMRPLSFGAFRNRAPQLVDSEALLYRVHDTTIANIAVVRDMGEVLDINASPPQYVPAFNKAGFQLQSPPAGKILVDGSSVGQQAAVPGTPDVLNSVGLIRSTTNPGVDGPGVTTWTGAATPSLTPPSGWSYTSTAAGTFTRLTDANGYPQDWAMAMSTTHIYNPILSELGISTFVTTPFLQPGEHYRFRFVLDRVDRPNGNVNVGGFMLRTDLTLSTAGEVSGHPFGPYLTAPSFGGQNYIFDYACPADGIVRSLYMIMVGGGVSLPAFSGTWHGLTVEKLGQFIELPVDGITFADYAFEILWNRAYEPTTTWNAGDFMALDVATNYKFGICFDDPPNILRDCLLPPLSSVAATLFTDKVGAARVARLADPRTLTPSVRFDLTNTQRPIQIEPVRAEYLTTLFGARRNWSVSGPSDFTSDFVGIPPEVRDRYSRTSQFQVQSSKTPAGQYSHAIGAPVYDTLGDDPDVVQAEGDRVVGIFSPTVYPDGFVSSGKRRMVRFPVLFDEIESLGAGTTLPAEDLLLGMGAVFNYPERDFNEEPGQVHETELFPFAGKIVCGVFF